jgi:hypothetical protein
VLFTPTRAGTATAVLTLHGTGAPLGITLRATAFGPPRVSQLVSTSGKPCFASASGNRLLVTTDQRSMVRWQVVREPHGLDPTCSSNTGGSDRRSKHGRPSARGQVGTAAHPAAGKVAKYLARFGLPVEAGSGGLLPGAYRLTVTATNAHGTGRPSTAWLTVLP